MLPFYAALGIEIGAILTDNGREFCGRPDAHRYELLLAMEGRTTRVRSPRTNGFVERMNPTLLDERFRVKGRTDSYLSPDEIQPDLDVFLDEYNLRRTHQGYRVMGRTPAQALREALGRGTAPLHPAGGVQRPRTVRRLTPYPETRVSGKYRACTYRARPRRRWIHRLPAAPSTGLPKFTLSPAPALPGATSLVSTSPRRTRNAQATNRPRE